MILQELYRYYERVAEEEDSPLPKRYWSKEKVAWELTITSDGEIASLFPLTTGEGKQLRQFIEMEVPEHTTRSSGILPFFLCDKASYFMGADEKRGADQLDAIRTLHQNVLHDIDDEGAHAILAFLEGDNKMKSLSEEQLEQLKAGGFIVFRLDGNHGYLHERPSIASAWKRYKEMPSDTDVHIAQCSATGETTELARLFPTLKGVAGAQSSGASLVSFNEDSFESYGKKQAYNAALSEKAAFATGAALQYLLSSDDHRIRIADTTFVIWADRPAPIENKIALNMFGGSYVTQQLAEDSQQVDRVTALLEEIKKSKRPSDLDYTTRFFILGLSPNAARLSVRFFFVSTLDKLIENYLWYLRDIEMTGVGDLPLFTYLQQLAPQGKSDKIPSTLINSCYTSMLKGALFPRALIMLVLSRMRSDQARNNRWDLGRRAALIKACLVREQRLARPDHIESDNTTQEGSITVALNEENTNVGYILGRLFAVMEKVQQEAIKDVGTTISDRYYGSASTTPARVFTNLDKLTRHHLSKIKGEKPGLFITRDRQLYEIYALLDDTVPFPKTLATEDQAFFIVGYYQQKQSLWEKKASKEPTGDLEN